MLDRDLVGETLHTAFRKAASSETAAQIHKLIYDLPADDWESILDFVIECLEPPDEDEEEEEC